MTPTTLLVLLAVTETLPYVIGGLTAIGTVLAAWLSTRQARRSAKETIVLTREQGAEKLIQAANDALARENERLYRIQDRKNMEIERLEEEVVELERQLAECLRR